MGRFHAAPDLEGEGLPMIEFSDWFPLATVGSMFTHLGGLKFWGLKRGIVGGADKPVVQRLCGT
jgi:hypothetical protein